MSPGLWQILVALGGVAFIGLIVVLLICVVLKLMRK